MVSRYKFYDEGCGVRSSIIMCIFELGFRPFTSLIFVFRLLSNDDSAAGRRRNIITMGSSDRGRNVLSTYERAFSEKFCPGYSHFQRCLQSRFGGRAVLSW